MSKMPVVDNARASLCANFFENPKTQARAKGPSATVERDSATE